MDEACDPNQDNAGAAELGASTRDHPGAVGRNAASSRTDAPPFPLSAHHPRYQGVRFLGEGGMGQVFLALDLRLRRHVALKFVRGDDPALARQLIAEARAQARVTNPRVCPVYEVGETDGAIYIAMQYVDGPPLGQLAPALTLGQRVELVREAALGVEAAHAAGLVHRDLKPGNILVERTAHGGFAPFVVDFGLARDARQLSTTASVSMAGTPDYMAPEQARGEVAAIDRRTDVYGLGATLYGLACGRPPFCGPNALAVLQQVIHDEPRPAREVDPAIPADLDAILRKCLQKSPADRYPTARALAADLTRFLDGEPVQARAGAGLGYRLWKRLRKQRAAAVVVVLGLAALGGLAGQQVGAARRARAAGQLGAKVDLIGALVRSSRRSPIHDTRPDVRQIEHHIGELQALVAAAGALDSGPGHYALGSVAFAAGHEAEARRHLEAAWAVGDRDPGIAYRLALLAGRRYQSELDEAGRQGDPAQRRQRRLLAEQGARTEAIEWLRRLQGAQLPQAVSPAALLDFYEGRLDEALATLDDPRGRQAWFDEVPSLRGDLLRERAWRHWNRGERAAALADFDAGRAAYLAAAEHAPSDPAIWRALARLELTTMTMELYGAGGVARPFERGRQAIATALRIAPDDPEAHLVESWLYRAQAEFRAGGNSDAATDGGTLPVEELLGRAVAAARAAGDDDRARLALATAFWQWGQYRLDRSEDPRPELEQARRAFASLSSEARSYPALVSLAMLEKAWADYETGAGGDPAPHDSAAITALRAAIALDDQRTEAWIDLALTLLGRAVEHAAPDPDADFAGADEALERARARGPDNVVVALYAGELRWRRARHLRSRGAEATGELDEALAAYRHGLTLNPRLPQLHAGVGTVRLEQARESWDHGGDPEPHLEAALAAFRQQRVLEPDDGFALHNIGETLLARARYQAWRGRDPGVTVRAAVAAIEQAREPRPDDPAEGASLAAAHLVEAGYALEHGRDPAPAVARAEEALGVVAPASPLDANDPERALRCAELLAMRVRVAAGRRGLREGEVDAARAAFDRAVERAIDDPDPLIAAGWFWLEVAGARATTDSRGSGAARERAILVADQAIAARSEAADAHLLRAAALLASAEANPAGGFRRALAQRARDEFSIALRSNRNLAPRWQRAARRADALLAAAGSE